MNKNYNKIAFVCLTATSLSIPNAHAALEEIIVTAEKRETSLQDTDISITVMNAANLEEMGVSKYSDIGNFAPNLMIHEQPGKVGAAIGIRGFKNAETIATFEPKVALYMDGVLIAKNAGSAFDILDLERIEILRGPQGTLYGRNTVGGAVNLVTRKPQFERVEGKFTATLGSFDQKDAHAILNVPLGEELAMKVGLASLRRDGYWDNDLRDVKEGDKDRLVGQFQLMWQATDDLSFLYGYDRSKVREQPWPVQLIDYNPAIVPTLAPYIADGSSSTRNLDFPAFQEADVYGHSITAEWGINDNLTMVAITALRSVDNSSSADSDGAPLFRLSNKSGDDVETFTQELRFIGTSADENLDYTLGAFYMDETIDKAYTISFLIHPSYGYTESGKEASAQNDVWAIFGETTYRLTDELELTVGLRYTKEDREMSRTDANFIPAASIDSTTTLPEASGDFSDTSGTVSLTYHYTHNLMNYVKYSKGYVSGGFNPRSPSPGTFTEGYDEETVNTYELGLKSLLFESKLQFNAAVFYNDYTDLQVNLLDQATSLNNIGNAGDAVLEGAELEVLVSPIDALEFNFGYGYLETEYKTYIDPISGADLSKNSFAHAPRHSLNGYIRYVIPALQNLGELSARIDGSYRSEHALLSAPGNEVGGYHLYNARLTLDNISGPLDHQYRVALWGENLTDETYYTSGYNLLDTFGFRAVATSAPRSYGIDLELRF